MRLSIFTLATLLLAFSLATAQSNQPSISYQQDGSKSVNPEKWQKITIEGKFSFRLPPEMKQTKVSGIESLMREYKSDKVRVYFVYQPGSFLSHDSRMLGDKKDYKEVVFKISGKPATLFSYSIAENSPLRLMSELYVGDWEHDHVELIMVAEAQNVVDLETAKLILESVRFDKPAN